MPDQQGLSARTGGLGRRRALAVPRKLILGGRRLGGPVVAIRIDGERAFEKVAKEWQGFDPGKILGVPSPLVPDEAGRRVAVYRCSCGESGCGVIAPFILGSPDRERISWVDLPRQGRGRYGRAIVLDVPGDWVRAFG
jgi:hypothetical protein